MRPLFFKKDLFFIWITPCSLIFKSFFPNLAVECYLDSMINVEVNILLGSSEYIDGDSLDYFSDYFFIEDSLFLLNRLL